MLVVSTWLWGSAFGVDDVAKLVAGFKRHLSQPHRFLLNIDDVEREGLFSVDVNIALIRDRELLKVKGCFARLRMFDPVWQEQYGIDDRLVNVDLDTVITGPLDPLFDRPEQFAIMQGGNAANPCPYNGALMMLRPGVHSEVWGEFSLEAAGKVPFHSFPDDQGWIAAKVPNAPGWKVGPEHGVYVYQKPGWPGGKSETKLPDDAKLVTFINKMPDGLWHLDWVKKHWVA